MKVVSELPSKFNQVSVSGGEPTISPDERGCAFDIKNEWKVYKKPF